MPARLTRLRAALPLLYLAAPLLGAGSVVAFHWSFSTLLVLDRVTHLAMACVGAAVLVIMGIALRRPPSPVARERLRIMLLGLGGAFLVPVLAVTAVYTTRASVPFNYLTLGLACFPAAAAYAIARHDLFGVDRLIRRTVAYVAVSVALGLTYAALLAYVHYVVMPERPVSAPIHILITMLLVVLFSPLRIRIQALVDLLYFRAPYDYRRTVAAASRALTSLLDLDEIVSRLVQIITEQMQVTHARVWLRDPASGAVRCEGGAGPEVAGDGPLMTFLGAQPGRVLYVGLGASEGRVPRRAVAALEAVGAALAVPMLFEQSVVGFLALGEKRSGHLYSTDDIQLLTTLANQAAVAIQNARAYRALAEANRELHEARDQLVEAERLVAIGELSAAVAHGIRNPVAGIKMAADLAVRQARPDDPLRESFVDILTEADALESRIRDLLDFARPFVPHYAPGDLNEVVRGTLHLLRRQLAEREITISTVLPPALPPHEFDHAQIEQVCLALVTNAIEAMSAGGTLTVAVSSDGGPAEGEIELRVHDAGHGIPPDELGKVFRLFFTKKARGTGVGLAIVKRIVEAHRGRIHVQSRAGEGTEFRVVLPTHSAHARPAPGAAAPPADGGLSRSGARRSRSR
jgi:signal transduction histidine kinase